MKPFKIILFFLSIALSGTVFSQNIDLKANQKVFIDHLENIYTLEKENLKLISSEKDIEYQNNFLGEIQSIDISNPLQILIFHKEANQIIFLNNELSEIGPAINLDDLGLFDVELVSASQINGFWVFNAAFQRIEFYDHRLEKVHTSIDLSLLLSDAGTLQELSMVNDNIYLRSQDAGILVFDRFANYIKTLPIKDCNSIQYFNQKILYTQAQSIKSYQFDLLETSTLLQLEQAISFAKLYNKTLYYRVGDVLFKKMVE